MARLDYHTNTDGTGYLLDCQADVLSHFDTRLVVPLIPLEDAPIPAGRLNPLFQIDGILHSMVTQFAGSVPRNAIGRPVGSLREHEFRISNALDMLLSGF